MSQTQRSMDAVLMLCLMLATLIVSQVLVSDFHRPVDFDLYHLANNLHNGTGMILDIDNGAGPLAAPILPVLLSVSPDHASVLAAWIYLASLALAQVMLYILLRDDGLPTGNAFLAALSLGLMWPSWAAYRSPASLALLSILIALWLLRKDRPRSASLMIGITPLFLFSAIAGVLSLLIQQQARHKTWWQWFVALIPIAAWIMVLLATYPDLVMMSTVASTKPNDVLWLALFVVAALFLFRTPKAAPWHVVFVLWAVTQVCFHAIISGTLSVADGIPLSVTIALAVANLADRSVLPRWSLAGVITLTLLTFAAPPRTQEQVETELRLGQTLGNVAYGTSVATNGSLAFVYGLPDFNGKAYLLPRLDDTDANVAQTADYLVRHVPQYVIDIDHQALDPVMSSPDVAALGYRRTDEPRGVTVWITGSQASAYGKTIQENHNYGPEFRLASYAVAGDPQPSALLRLRLDWELVQLPDEGEVAFNISIIDQTGFPAATRFTTYPATSWQSQQRSTYHALRLPPDLVPGLFDLSVTVDFRAGTLGQAVLQEIIVPFPPAPVDSPVLGDLGAVQLVGQQLSVTDRLIQFEHTWSVTQDLAQDYQVFLHLSTTDNLAPLTQADGPPVAGRYPSRSWRAGDTIVDQRLLDVSSIPPGEYQINVGFFAADGSRLSGTNGDFLTPTIVRISQDGTISTQPADENT